MSSLNEALVVILPLVGGLAWLFQLKGRIDGHDVQHKQHEAQYNLIRDDVAYIRERIDTVLLAWTRDGKL